MARSTLVLEEHDPDQKMPNRLSPTTTNAGYSQLGSTVYGFRTPLRSAAGLATGSESATSGLSNYGSGVR
jgi:hypothetical protein